MAAGASSIARTTAKFATLAPMPRATVATATNVNDGILGKKTLSMANVTQRVLHNCPKT